MTRHNFSSKNITLSLTTTALLTAVLANSAYALEQSQHVVMDDVAPETKLETKAVATTDTAPTTAALASTATLPNVADATVLPTAPNLRGSDPLEPYNRFMFKVNTGLDNRIAKPVAKGYKRVTPKPVRNGVGNFFSNLAEPWTAINLLLQGKPVSSLKSLGRFTVNTVTTLGFGDPASSALDLNTTREDFGQTLGVWGVPSGPYLVLPVLGPSTLRDSSGRAVDIAGNPLTYIDNTGATAAITTVNATDKRARLMTFEGIVDSSNYELVRDAFLEKRAFDIQESGNPEEQTAEPTFDEGFGD